MTQIIRQLSHHPRLGRHVQHDPRSLAFAVGVLPKSALKGVLWQRRSPIFDQGQIGSCTGNAGAGWLATDNAAREGFKGIDESKAVELYELATVLDGLPGQYPPDDSGSSGLGVAKALQKDGYVNAYTHAFSLDAVFSGLQAGPGLLGIPWYNSMFDPFADGQVKVDLASGMAGGHEILIDQLELDVTGVPYRVWFSNSWGPTWGLKGRGYVVKQDLATLLSNQGDVVFPVTSVTPTPTPAPTPPGMSLVIPDDLIPHINRAAGLHQETPDQWATNLLRKHFHMAV